MRLCFVHGFLFLSTLFLTFCSQPSNGKINNHKEKDSGIDTSEVAVIDFDKNPQWPFKPPYRRATLSDSEVELIDSLVKQYVLSYNQKLASGYESEYSIDFKKYKYKRQYMPVLNGKGQKEVWVNGFCQSRGDDWKTKMVIVDDGGNCFFNLKINLATKVCYDISVNGYA